AASRAWSRKGRRTLGRASPRLDFPAPTAPRRPPRPKKRSTTLAREPGKRSSSTTSRWWPSGDFLKGAEPRQVPTRLGALRTFNPARGGEGLGALQGIGPQPASWARHGVRRAMPFAFAAAVLAAILGVIDAAAVQPAFAFPLFVGLVVFGAVLAGVAVATSELFRQSRLTAAEAQDRLQDLTVQERRLSATVEAAEVGLGLADLDGNLTQVSTRL